jgi:hypothetical protein
MSRLTHIVRSLGSQPGYTLMRGVARFRTVREAISHSRRLLQGRRLRSHLAACEARMPQSVFAPFDHAEFVRRLRDDGVAFGLKLPESMTREILDHAAQHPCFADREPGRGFRFDDRGRAEAALGKPILVAQYFNVGAQSAAVERLLRDPALQWIAGAYLESVPTFVGANLWWTFPVQAREEDRDRHAHLFHRDVDDFRFFKFFFYLTDVASGDGAHVCVVASHRRPPMVRPGDRWNIRRYTDAEIARCFDAEQVVEVCGPAGTGFAENTLCVHKGLTPTRDPRLLLQLQYALFDYGVMHDRRAPAALQMIA